MIKVLHYGLSTNLGGIETYLYKLYSNIDRNKFEFHFIISGDKKPYWNDDFISMGSKFFHVTSRSKNPIKNRREISQLLKDKEFDIVHCHLNSLSYMVPVHLALRFNYQVIVHSRNAGVLKSKKTRFLHRLNSLIIPKSRLTMVAVSDFAGLWMFGKNTDFIVINNGLNESKYIFDQNARIKIRKDFGIKSEKVIVHLGAFREQKNHTFLLEIFRVLIKKEANVKLLLVGDGSLKLKILKKINELQIEGHVIIAGNRSDVSDILSASDIFLFPSLYEGFPNAVLEAQASGLPCLISDSITKEVIINENCEIMSLEKSPEEWVNRLLNLKQLSNRTIGSKNIVLKGLSVKEEINKVENLYLDLFSKSINY